MMTFAWRVAFFYRVQFCSFRNFFRATVGSCPSLRSFFWLPFLGCGGCLIGVPCSRFLLFLFWLFVHPDPRPSFLFLCTAVQQRISPATSDTLHLHRVRDKRPCCHKSLNINHKTIDIKTRFFYFFYRNSVRYWFYPKNRNDFKVSHYYLNWLWKWKRHS